MSFTFSQTEERSNFLEKRGHVVLSACPGSGKTTVLAYKLLPLIEEVKKKYGDYAGVLCLSFTNVAKEEITEKYRLFSGQSLPFPSEVSTINSFVNTRITLPFYRLLLGKEIRPQIMENEEFDKVIRHNIYYKKYLIDKKPIYYKYPPSKFSFNSKGQLILPYNPKFASKAEEDVFSGYSNELKSIQIQKGIFKNGDSVFIAVKILEKVPRLTTLLVKRFPYILIDEAQDTSEDQYSLFNILLKGGVDGMEMVGDHYQAIYEWRGAKPDTFVEISSSKEWQLCVLSECKRSCQPIIDVYSGLRSSGSKPITSSSEEVNKIKHPVQVVLYTKGSLTKAVDLYESEYKGLDSNIVLVRGTNLLNTLTGKTRELSPWKSSIPQILISAKESLDKGKIKVAVNMARSIIPQVEEPDLSYRERKQKEKILKEDYKLNSNLLVLLKKLPSIEKSLVDWTTESESLVNNILKLKTKSDFTLKQGVWKKQHKTPLHKVLGKEQSDINTQVSTIHGVKGMTFDSVMLILSSTSSGASLSISDYCSADGIPNEKQRLLYVAMSRAKHLLMLGIPEDSCSKEQVEKLFGERVKIHKV